MSASTDLCCALRTLAANLAALDVALQYQAPEQFKSRFGFLVEEAIEALGVIEDAHVLFHDVPARRVTAEGED
jgi:hypothetical protein